MAVRTKYSHCLLVWLHSSVLPIASDYDISPVWKEKFDQNIPIRQEKNPAECWCRARWCRTDTLHAAVLGLGHVTTGVSCHTLQWNEFYYITKHVWCISYRMIFSPGCCDEMRSPDSRQQRGSWQWQWGQREAAAGTRMGASHRHAVTRSRCWVMCEHQAAK